jgi:hypothetical protein
MNISKMNCFKIIILPLALILVWAAGNIPSLLNLEPLYTHADWKLSQYNVNYFDHGFIRRGLIGTIIFPIFNKITEFPELQKIIVFWKETFFFLIYSTAVSLFIITKTQKQPPIVTMMLLSCVLLSPCGLIQASYDFGRYDHANFVVLSLCIFLVHKKAIKTVSILLAIAVLIHENSIFYVHPLVASLVLSKPIKDLKRLLILAAPSCLITGLVFLFGDKTVDLPSNISLGAAVWGEGIHLYILNPGQTSISVFVFLAYLITLYAFIIHFYKTNNIKIDLNLIVCFAPLILFIIAADWGRWVHYVLINIFINLGFKISKIERVKFTKFSYLCLAIIALPLGPIGIGDALPYLELIYKKLLIAN